jgi:preprotein translocase SecE subunit
VARDRKRSRRSGRPNRPTGPTPPTGAGGLGLPDVGDAAEFPGLEALGVEPVNVAASAFGEEPVLGTGEPALGPGASPTAREPGNRLFVFLRGSWAELQRVQWPDRRQVAQATGVVLGFVVVAGVFLGIADEISQKIVDAIL